MIGIIFGNQPHRYPSRISIRAQRASPDRMDIDQIGTGRSWMDPILAYLTTGSLPIEKVEARRIRYRSARYHVIDGALYKRGYTLPYLRCVHPTQIGTILSEIYKGICGSYIGGRALSRRVLLQGYYWPTMDVRAL